MDWNALAARYEAQVWLERSALRSAVRLARPRPEHRLLDVGTGTGAALKLLAQRPCRPRLAVGVDSSPAMLARIGPLPENWHVVAADARALPFEPDSFDVVLLAYVLHVLDAAARIPVLLEIHRVLRPGGAVVTVTPTLPGSSGNRIHRWVSRRLESEAGPRRGLLPLDPRPALAAAGFQIEELRRVWLGYPSVCVRARRS